jgi:hypothetical protein
VTKDDIAIVFYHEDGSWKAEGEFSQLDVHKQVAITFRTPTYKNINITEPVKVKVQLRRKSNKSQSAPIDFEMLPLGEGNSIKRFFTF